VKADRREPLNAIKFVVAVNPIGPATVKFDVFSLASSARR